MALWSIKTTDESYYSTGLSTFYFDKQKLWILRWSSIVCLTLEFLSVIFQELWIVCFHFFLLITRTNKWGLKQGDFPSGMSVGGHNGHVPLLPHLLEKFLQDYSPALTKDNAVIRRWRTISQGASYSSSKALPEVSKAWSLDMVMLATNMTTTWVLRHLDTEHS